MPTWHRDDADHRPRRPTLLAIEGVTKSFGPTVALRDCSLELRAGKSTPSWARTARASPPWSRSSPGCTEPDGGLVRIEQVPLRARSPRAAVAAGVATVFQEVQCVPGQSVFDNLWLGTDGMLRRVGRVGGPARRRRGPGRC